MLEDILQMVDDQPSEVTLRDVARQAELLKEKQHHLEKLEQLVKDTKAQIKDIAEDVIPTMMLQAGLSEYKLEDGSKVSVKENVYAHISKANAQAAFQWLRNNDYGDIIKNEVVASFSKGEDERATDLLKHLQQELELNATQKEAVHPSTLKAFAKERVESGDTEFPTELFGVHVVREASVK